MKSLINIQACPDCATRHISIFRNLSRDETELLNKQRVCNFYKRGSVLYHEGNRINGFYCVNKGIVKLFKTGMEGKEQIIRFAKEGEVIGFRSILSNELACTTAKVLEDSVMCYFPGEVLFGLIKTNGRFAMELVQLACRELGEANKFITDIAQKTVRERLSEVLVLLEETFHTEDDHTLKITLTREELANMVGTATESVIRLLSEFKSDKLIELSGRKIKLIDIPGLKRIAGIFP
jgi:CRP-like cAMP-binding protein